jgi:hypothetical protein
MIPKIVFWKKQSDRDREENYIIIIACMYSSYGAA